MRPKTMGSGNTKEKAESHQDIAKPDSLDYHEKDSPQEVPKENKRMISGNIPGFIEDTSSSKNNLVDSGEATKDPESCSPKVKIGKEIRDAVSDAIKENCMDGLTANFENSDSNSNLCSSNTSSLTKNIKKPSSKYGKYQQGKGKEWRSTENSIEHSVQKSPMVSSANLARTVSSESKEGKSSTGSGNAAMGRRRYSAESLKHFKKNMHTYKGLPKEKEEYSEEAFREGLSSESYASKARYSYIPRRKNSYNDALEEDSRMQREKTLRKQVAFAVEETVCGLVIGKGGVNVKKLEKTLGVEIIVNAKKDEKATKRIVTILGTNPVAIQRARDELDFQQVFIPVLGPYQMKLVARASQDKFQKWRIESGCTRIEFEHSLEDYDPEKFSGQPSTFNGYHDIETMEPLYSTRQKIQLKKQEATENHNGFLRLVGTRVSVKKAQVFIENELDRANKIGMFDPKTKKEEVENTSYNVMNMDSNYSRNAHLKPPHTLPGSAYGSLGVGRMYEPGSTQYNHQKYQVAGPAGMNHSTNTMVYQLWKQQQELQKIAHDTRTSLAHLNMNLYPSNYRPGYNAMDAPAHVQQIDHQSNVRGNVSSTTNYAQNYGHYYPSGQKPTTMRADAQAHVPMNQKEYIPQPGQQYQYSGQGRGRFRVVEPRKTTQQRSQENTRPPEFQRNLDDMLLEGKLSVDEYAIKLAKRDN